VTTTTSPQPVPTTRVELPASAKAAPKAKPAAEVKTARAEAKAKAAAKAETKATAKAEPKADAEPAATAQTSPPSLAQPAESAGGVLVNLSSLVTFQGLDQNADQGLAKEEVLGDPVLANFFDNWDQDKDGRLSDPEYTAYRNASFQVVRAQPATKTRSKAR
jgi:hypothetical protein